MRTTNLFLAAMSVSLALTSMPATAQSATEDARQLRQLDMMLMVTNLRCRRLGEDFTSEYNSFTTAHLQTMRGANRQLLATYGGNGSAREKADNLDRIITSMANNYGLGHPWLECAQLRRIADDLSQERGRTELLAAANQLLAAQPSPTTTFAIADQDVKPLMPVMGR